MDLSIKTKLDKLFSPILIPKLTPEQISFLLELYEKIYLPELMGGARYYELWIAIVEKDPILDEEIWSDLNHIYRFNMYMLELLKYVEVKATNEIQESLDAGKFFGSTKITIAINKFLDTQLPWKKREVMIKLLNAEEVDGWDWTNWREKWS